MPSSRAIGPLTTMSGATGCVVACTESRLKSGSASASIAARITGRYSGWQPAITALAAIFSTVASPCRGGSTPTISRASRVVWRKNSRTRASVGGADQREVALGERVQRLRRRRARHRLLALDDLAGAVAFLKSLCDGQHQRAGVGLAVVEDTDPLALQSGQARGQLRGDGARL